MSTILTNKIETKSGGLTLDPGAGGSVTVLGSLSGTITTAAQTNITSVGTLTNLTVTNDVRSGQGIRIGAATDGTTGQFLTDGTNTYLDYNGFLSVRRSSSSAESVRIDSSGNVGIGTSSPAEKLHIGSGNIKLDNGYGIDFSATAGGGATSSLLDDYEEGTWTMGITFGGAASGVTYRDNTGSYTKIGRQVTVTGFLFLLNIGASTGPAVITGLPFTIGSTNIYYSAPTLRLFNTRFANQFQGNGQINSTTILLTEITESGAESSLTNADFTNDSGINISFTYFV